MESQKEWDHQGLRSAKSGKERSKHSMRKIGSHRSQYASSDGARIKYLHWRIPDKGSNYDSACNKNNNAMLPPESSSNYKPYQPLLFHLKKEREI